MKNFLSAWVGCLLALNIFSGEIPPWIPAAPAVQGAYPLIQAGEIPGTPPVIRTIPLEGEWKTACVATSAVPFPDDVDRKAGFAEKEFESEVFIDDGTADQEKSECGHRGEQFIRYKFNRLATTLPEASEYFVSKRTPFIESILKVDGIKDDNLNDVPVDIGAHAVEACAVVPVQTVAYTVVKNGLVFGDKKCGPGTRAFLNMSCMPPIAGVIRGITKQKIDFVPDGQAPMSIPLTSLNYHLASITLP